MDGTTLIVREVTSDSLEGQVLKVPVASVSFGGTQAPREELREIGPSFVEDVMVSQVVPPPTSKATGVLRFRKSLKKHFPKELPAFIALEGYVVGHVLGHALHRADTFDMESVIDALEETKELDLCIGAIVSFGPSRHQASNRVWAVGLRAEGDDVEIDLTH